MPIDGIGEDFWDDPNMDGPYDWENIEDIFGIVHQVYGKNMKFGYSIINELQLSLPNIASVLGCDAKDLFVLNYVFCRHMYNNATKDRAISSHGIDGVHIQYDVPLHKGNNAVFVGYTLFQCRGLDKKYVIFSVPSVSGERFYCTIMKKGDVFAIKRHFQKQQRKNNKQSPPILADNLVDDVVTNSIGFLLNKRKIERYDVKIRRGILLSGEPGNGKTMLCRWIQRLCDEKDITWGVVTASEIERTFAEGHGLENLFNSFQVTFFDDIDIGYLSRSAGKGEIACAILSAMDGINQSEHVVRIFTTNEHMDKMDPAFIRPGRIDRCFNIGHPTAEQRRKLIEERWDREIFDYLKSSNNLERLIDITKEFSFAELEAIKTIMVTNKLMKTNKWDLDDAIDDFYRSRDSWAPNKTVSFGFHSSSGVINKRPSYFS